jgi:hypothetical protein
MFTKEMSNPQSIDGFVTGNKDDGFGKSLIDDSEYRIEPHRFGEFDDKIYGNLGKGARVFGVVEWFEGNTNGMSNDFVLLTGSTSFDIAFNETAHSGPPIGTGEELKSLLLTRVSSHDGVMMIFNQVSS